MSTIPEEIKFYILSLALLFLLIISFTVIFIVLFYKKQNQHIIQTELDKEKLKNLSLQKEIEIKQELIKERERISSDLHDDIGASFSVIKLKSEILKSKSTDKEINQGLENIIINAKEIERNIKEIMWSLKSKNDTLEDFISFIEKYSESFFENSNIKFNSNYILAENIILSGFLRRNLFLVIKESFNNVLKHSHATIINFEIKIEEPKILKIKIEDNGTGITEIKNTGNGLINMENRAQQINAKFNFGNSDPGFYIEIVYPFQ